MCVCVCVCVCTHAHIERERLVQKRNYSESLQLGFYVTSHLDCPGSAPGGTGGEIYILK